MISLSTKAFPPRLSKTWQSFKHPKNSLISSKPDRAHICTIILLPLRLADTAVASEAVPTTSGKSPSALKDGIISSSVTPTPEPSVPEDSSSTPKMGCSDPSCSMGIVVISSLGPGDELRPPRLRYFATSLKDHVTPPGYWAVLRNQSAASFLDAFNINSAQHTCMQRKEKIAALRARLEETEREAAKVVALRHHVFELEVGVIVKSQDIDTLSKQNAKLLSKVYALESGAKERIDMSHQAGGDCSIYKIVVGEAKVPELDASIVDYKHDIDNDLYPHMFTAIAGRRWILSHGVRLAVMKCAQSTEFRSALGKVISLEINKGIEEGLEARIEHGKSGQTLDRVEAYNPEFKDEFVSAITDFENLQRFQPSLDQVTVPIYSKSGSVSGEMFLSEVIPTAHAAAEKRGLCPPLLGGTSSSAPPHGSSLGVADYQVSTLVLSGDG
ncbi:hypothetical protein Tco_0549454 [Tanacetum coccineum]